MKNKESLPSPAITAAPHTSKAGPAPPLPQHPSAVSSSWWALVPGCT